jgi:hypothetical protein
LDASRPGWRRYLVKFARVPRDMGAFVRVLDESLCRYNEDYAAHRVVDLTMQAPEFAPSNAAGLRVQLPPCPGLYQGTRFISRVI